MVSRIAKDRMKREALAKHKTPLRVAKQLDNSFPILARSSLFVIGTIVAPRGFFPSHSLPECARPARFRNGTFKPRSFAFASVCGAKTCSFLNSKESKFNHKENKSGERLEYPIDQSHIEFFIYQEIFSPNVIVYNVHLVQTIHAFQQMRHNTRHHRLVF